MFSRSAKADVPVVPADVTPRVRRRQARACVAHHESAGLPTTGSRLPSLGRGRGSADRSVDGHSVDVSTVGSIGGTASRDATARRCRLHEHQRHAPVPPASCQGDPKESIARLQMGSLVSALHRRQLLAQGQVLQDQLLMAAQRKGQPADNHDEQFQHGSIVAGVAAQFNPDEFWRGSASTFGVSRTDA